MKTQGFVSFVVSVWIGVKGMSDCIDRALAMTGLQANAQMITLAYEIGYGKLSDEVVRISDAMNVLRDLPSAQPEIIMCKDCKHYIDNCCYERNHIKIGLFLHEDNFCSWGERRTND